MFKHGDLHATNQIKPKTMKMGERRTLTRENMGGRRIGGGEEKVRENG